MPVIECDVDVLRPSLIEAGVEVNEGNTPYERWRAAYGEGVAVAYDGKVVIQGRSPQRLAALVRTAIEGDGDGEEGGEGSDAPSASDRAYCYFDGASRGNPGPAAVGWVVVAADGIVAEGGERIPDTTNNRAEYEALIRVLEVAGEYGFRAIDARGDSAVIVRQVRGEYQTNQPELRERRVTVRELLRGFGDWTIEHVPREANDRADAQANEALDRD
jgi:ribonuclease HI